MRVPIVVMLFLAAAAFLMPGCGDTDPAVEAACVCEQGKAGETVWCEACKAGYAGSEKTTCRDCWKGRTGEAVWCEACKAGYVDEERTGCHECFEGKTGAPTWCEACDAGYVDGKKTACKDCVKAATGDGECPVCSK